MRLLLDLFCGAGGAAEGYRRAGYYVVGVDIRPQPHYRGEEFHQGDALEFLAAHGREFDVIHASPPCQRYSQCTPLEYRERHPDLIGATRAALETTARPYIIENVPGARNLLRAPGMLCGTMFGLPLFRHRYFEVRPQIAVWPQCCHTEPPVLVSGTTRRKSRGRKEYSAAEKRAAMGIDWMTTPELDEAIPPAYTEWIGTRLK